MAEKTSLAVKNGPSTVSRWRDPLETFDALWEDMARLWEQSWPTTWPLWRPTRLLAPKPGAWTPRVDVFEKDGKLIVKAELPGVKKEDVSLSLEEGDLIIRGTRHEESEVKEEHYHRMERSSGAFYRRMAMPFPVTPEKIEASF